GERRPTPERECGAEAFDALFRARCVPCLLEQTLEAEQVDRLALGVEQVARRLRAQHPVTEQLPQRRDRILERALRGWRRSLTPESTDTAWPARSSKAAAAPGASAGA